MQPPAEPIRCFAGDAAMNAYHDGEWGRPVRDERGIYERLCLEAFQSGLSWSIVLRKRAALRTLYHNFDPDAVARLGEADVERLAGDAAGIRNRAKIRAVIDNARATLALRDTPTPLPALVWSFEPVPREAPRRREDIPAASDEARALAASLRAHGFRFVGPTTAYALMQAIGMVNDHLATCPVRADVERLRSRS